MTVIGIEFPPDMVLGVVTGLTYALLGLGLTLVYRTSRALNFAHGEMGALPALLVPLLTVNTSTNYWVAAALAILVAAAIGATTEVVVVRRLEQAPRLLVLVATIGLSQLLLVAQLMLPKGRLGQATYPVPVDWSVSLGGVRIPPGHMMIILFVPVITVALTLFLKRTKIGLASRAAADNSAAAMLAGIPIQRVSMVMWTIAGALAGLSAILVGPTKPVLSTTATGPGLILRGLVAALVGGFVSLPWTFVGGVAVGILEFLVAWNWPTGGSMELLLFVTILGLLLFRRGLRSTTRGGEESSWSLAGKLRLLHPRVREHPRVVTARWILRGVVVGLAVLVPALLSNAHRTLLSSVVIFALMGASLVVLTGYAGQVSLGQFAFVTLGALVGGRMHQLGYPMGTSLVFVALAGALVAAIVGLPALRIRGLYLAVATLSFATASTTWLLGQPWLVAVRDGRSSLAVPRPHFLGIDFSNELSYYYLCLAFLVVLGAVISHMRTTGLGRAMMAVRDNEPAAATLSISPRVTKLTAFVIAGVVASIAGYLYGGLLVNFQSQPGKIFAPEQSLVVLAMTIFGGVTSVTGAVIGAIWLRGLNFFIAPQVGSVLGPSFSIVLSGIGLVAAVLQFPQGLAAALFERRDRLYERLAGTSGDEVRASQRQVGTERARLVARPVAANGHGPTTPHPLVAEGITVRYGGISAVESVDLFAAKGEIVGLIGPNGAGKTTLFDVLSGHQRPDVGRVLLDGMDVTHLRSEHRARMGLGRTFQQARLFEEMSLLDSFRIALERDAPSEIVPSMLALPPSRRSERAKSLRASELVELLGLEEFAHRNVGELSTGTRRFAELGCMVAMGAPVILLDEPTAGIAQREVEQFRPILREIRDHLDATMVLIDHDLPMVVDIVDRLYVMAAGKVIAVGDPQELRKDPRVVEAYLGTDHRAMARSSPRNELEPT